ncbi:MAG TPA: cell division protein [Bacteroidetes bacterium]|nr:cell division protein FtsW [Ignavibacteriaceae bacterium]HAY33681.1 cell division protein [Bacteroidota bacterium]HRI45834.1 putative peptidoglycan glycosyltransferase FtsW [Ignavibacteriaceae bacterium]
MKKLSISIFFGSFILILIGLYLVMSASSTYSDTKFANQFYMFNSHLYKAFLAVGFLVLFSFLPYEYYKNYSKPMILIIVTILVLTLIISASVKGGRRWIDLGFINFQPAELAKLFLFIHLAALIESKGEEIKKYKEGFRYALLWILFTCGLIFAQPNVSNASLLLLISMIVLYVGGARFIHIFFSLVISGIVSISIAMLFSHSRGRIMNFVESLMNGGHINSQVKQALYGLGSGGIWGVGFGHSSQRNLFLPEAYGDFIFAILGEERGFVGATFVLLIYLGVFIAGIIIAKNAKDKFGQVLGIAISLSFITYALVNIAVASGLIPTTGLPLPFISYGGTSLIIMSISIGILINIGVSNIKENLPPQIETAEI